MPSIQCCHASAILFSRTSRTCPRMPPSQNPLPRPTQCPSPIRQGTATRTHPGAAAVPPSRIHQPVLTQAVHSRCQVSCQTELTSSCFFHSHQHNALISSSQCRDTPSSLHAPRGADDSGLPPANGHQPHGSTLALREQ